MEVSKTNYFGVLILIAYFSVTFQYNNVQLSRFQQLQAKTKLGQFDSNRVKIIDHRASRSRQKHILSASSARLNRPAKTQPLISSESSQSSNLNPVRLTKLTPESKTYVKPPSFAKADEISHSFAMNSKTRERIKYILKELSVKHDVKIIYAAGVGIRMWFPSRLSDASPFDIRFVFVSRNKTYNVTSQILFANKDDRFNLTGYELNYALAWADELHPALFDMFYSSLVYKKSKYPDFVDEMQDILIKRNPTYKELLNNYREMAFDNYCRLLMKGPNATAVDYMTTVRALAIAEWLVLRQCDPRFPFAGNSLGDEKYSDLVEVKLEYVIDDLSTIYGMRVNSVIFALTNHYPKTQAALLQVIENWMKRFASFRMLDLHNKSDVSQIRDGFNELFIHLI